MTKPTTQERVEKSKPRDLFPNKETRDRIAWMITVITFVLTLLKDWKKILAAINEILLQPNWRLVLFARFAWLGYVLLTIEAVAILFVFSSLVLFVSLMILRLADKASDRIFIIPANLLKILV